MLEVQLALPTSRSDGQSQGAGVLVLLLAGGQLGEVVAGGLQKHREDIAKADNLDEAKKLFREHVFDWIVSAGFREIVPDSMLQSPTKTCNVHPSLLPWGKGAHPNVWAIVEGEPAGVSIHEMSSSVDAGPIYAQQEVVTTFGDTGKTLYDKLLHAAGQLFERRWPQIRDGELSPRPQAAGGSYHRRADLDALKSIEPDEMLTWRKALDILRALTFPPYENLIIKEDGRRYHVEVKLREIG